MTQRDSGSVLDGKYEILERLATGGMGEVWRARHIHLQELRVIKILRADRATDPHALQRFAQEARIATQIKHPNVAILYDFSRMEDGSFYMVWEHIDGEDVGHWLKTKGPFPVALAVELGIQALRGLEAIHGAGVIHRDLSPDNLMIARDRRGRHQVKIIDLGLAKNLAVTSGLEITQAGMFMGKLAYCSPEQAGSIKDAPLDHRSDVYSLAAVLYEMVTGRLPYDSESQHGYVFKRLTEAPIPMVGRSRGHRGAPRARHAWSRRGWNETASGVGPTRSRSCTPWCGSPTSCATSRPRRSRCRGRRRRRPRRPRSRRTPTPRPAAAAVPAPPSCRARSATSCWRRSTAPRGGSTRRRACSTSPRRRCAGDARATPPPSWRSSSRCRRATPASPSSKPKSRAGRRPRRLRWRPRCRRCRSRGWPRPPPRRPPARPLRPRPPGRRPRRPRPRRAPAAPDPRQAQIAEAERLLDKYLREHKQSLAQFALSTLLELAPNHPRRGDYESWVRLIEGEVQRLKRCEAAVDEGRQALARGDLKLARQRLDFVEKNDPSNHLTESFAAEIESHERQTRSDADLERRRDRLEELLDNRRLADAERELERLSSAGLARVSVETYRLRISDIAALAERDARATEYEKRYREKVAERDWMAARDVVIEFERTVPDSPRAAQLYAEISRLEEIHRKRQGIEQGARQVESFLAQRKVPEAELALKILLQMDPEHPQRAQLEQKVRALRSGA